MSLSPEVVAVGNAAHRNHAADRTKASAAAVASKQRGAGRFILSGYVIADEYRMTVSSGRAYRARHESAARTGCNVVGSRAGAARWRQVRWPIRRLRLQSAGSPPRRYRRYLHEHFLGRTPRGEERGEKSDDGKAWSEFMVIAAYRTKSKNPFSPPGCRSRRR